MYFQLGAVLINSTHECLQFVKKERVQANLEPWIPRPLTFLGQGVASIGSHPGLGRQVLRRSSNRRWPPPMAEEKKVYYQRNVLMGTVTPKSYCELGVSFNQSLSKDCQETPTFIYICEQDQLSEAVLKSWRPVAA